MTEIPTITIHMGKKCAECGKGGALGNGICLACVNKAMSGKRMKSARGLAVQLHIQKTLAEAKRK